MGIYFIANFYILKRSIYLKRIKKTYINLYNLLIKTVINNLLQFFKRA